MITELGNVTEETQNTTIPGAFDDVSFAHEGQ
jgi:hypothetical protein